MPKGIVDSVNERLRIYTERKVREHVSKSLAFIKDFGEEAYINIKAQKYLRELMGVSALGLGAFVGLSMFALGPIGIVIGGPLLIAGFVCYALSILFPPRLETYRRWHQTLAER